MKSHLLLAAVAAASGLVLAATPASAVTFFGPGVYSFVAPTAGLYEIFAAGGSGGAGAQGAAGSSGGHGGDGGGLRGYPQFPGATGEAGHAGAPGSAGAAGSAGLTLDGDFILNAGQVLSIYVGTRGADGLAPPGRQQAVNGFNGNVGTYAGGGGGGGEGGLGGFGGLAGDDGGYSLVGGLLFVTGGAGGVGGAGGHGGSGGDGGHGAAVINSGGCFPGLCGTPYFSYDAYGGAGGYSGYAASMGGGGTQGYYYLTTGTFSYAYTGTGGQGGLGGAGTPGGAGYSNGPVYGAGREYNLGSNPTSGMNFGDGYVFIDQLTQFAAVPEPSTWALMLIGVGLTGGMARRARARTGARVTA